MSLRGKKGYRRIYREPASSVVGTQAAQQVKVTSFVLDGFMVHICKVRITHERRVADSSKIMHHPQR
jgi:hypothetical protein